MFTRQRRILQCALYSFLNYYKGETAYDTNQLQISNLLELSACLTAYFTEREGK